MKDDQGNDIPMPVHVMAMLQPFVEVMNTDHSRPPRSGFHLTYIPEHDRPRDEQLRAIGRITTTWSVLERVFGLLLSRLALAPDYPAQALTKDLGLDNQIKAVKTLLALHHERYRHQVLLPEYVEVITRMLTHFAQLKHKRNVVAHTTWIHMGQDEIIALSARPRSGYFTFLEDNDFFRSRTPAPPPFSSMKSTPAASKQRLMTSSVARRGSCAAASS
jgi:hypothetical protein